MPKMMYTYSGPVSGLLRHVWGHWEATEPTEDERRMQNRKAWMQGAYRPRELARQAYPVAVMLVAMCAASYVR